MKKIIANAPLCVLLSTARAYKEQTNITNSRNSCLPTRIHPVFLKKSTKTFYIKFTQKRCINWHMISFIYSESEKFTDTGFMATS